MASFILNEAIVVLESLYFNNEKHQTIISIFKKI